MKIRKIGIQAIICIMILGSIYALDNINMGRVSEVGAFARECLQEDYSLDRIKEDAVTVMSNIVEKPKEVYAALVDGTKVGEFCHPVDELAVQAMSSEGGSTMAVYSSNRGMVESISEIPEEKGFEIVLRHDNGIITRYIGCTQIYVKELDRVSRGQLIGCVSNGKTGGFSFELWDKGEKKNPDDYIIN